MNRPVFIVGLQKGGTSLLVRLLEISGLGASTSGKVEDNWFWGHKPSFSPTDWPAGMIYQSTGGADGHEIGKKHATEEIITSLRERSAQTLSRHPKDKVVFGKSGYNTVRIPWVRAIFPESVIVAVVRRPVPHIFSLWKRYHPNCSGQRPEEGWWGVKPKGWRGLVQDNKIAQAAHQWNAVNVKLWQDRHLLDFLVPYHELCAEPEVVLSKLYKTATGISPQGPMNISPLRCFDDEYKRGSQLESKNKHYRDTGNLEIPLEECIEVLPFTDAEVEMVHNICRETAETMGLNSPAK